MAGAIGLVTQEGIISPAYVVLRPKKNACSLFMFYLFKSAHCLYFLQSFSYGLTGDRLRLYYKDFAIMPLTIPPLAEQERIAEVLGAWDRAISLTDRLIDTKQRLKKGLMQQLLTGRLRFPQFGKPSRKHGEQPKGWKSGHLGDLVKINRKSLPESTSPFFSFFYVDLACVDRGAIAYPSEPIRFKSAPSRARRIAERGDILMSTVRPNLLGYAVVDRAQEVVCSTGFAVLTPKNGSGGFAYHSLFSRGIQNQLAALTTGSNYPAVSASDVRLLRLAHPDHNEQECIASCLSACDREIQLLIRKRDRLQEQKKGLMQKLLTGEVRISVKGRKRNVS